MKGFLGSGRTHMSVSWSRAVSGNETQLYIWQILQINLPIGSEGGEGGGGGQFYTFKQALLPKQDGNFE